MPNVPEGGASLRYGDPWSDPPEARDPLRRLRGRLVLPVTVWTAATRSSPGAGPRLEELTGLTVSSVAFAQGDPGMLAGLLSPTSELAGLLQVPGARFAVHVLGANHRRLAQHFAGELPAPADMLELEGSTHGPLLRAVRDRALCTTSGARSFGYSLLVEAVVDDVQLAAPEKALAWYRGQFHALG